MTRFEVWALIALAVILLLTVAWWALALWPAGPGVPEWVLRTRAVCFGSSEGGLPDAEGWLALIGQPVLMLGILVAGWGGPLRRGLGRLAGRPVWLAWGGGLLVVLFAAAAVLRVATAGPAAGRANPAATLRAGMAPPRLDRPAPPLELLDQDGRRVTLAHFRGRPVVLTFAYGHCTTVCPLVVHDALQARRQAGRESAVLLVVTVDPWRDTPARLGHLVGHWNLEPGDRVLGGGVDGVLAALEAWNVPVERDLKTGEVSHPGLVYLVDAEGRIAFVLNGAQGPGLLAGLLARAG